MGYGILWLSHLAFTFFLIAATCAWASRRENPKRPRFWPLFGALLALVSVAACAVFGAFLIWANAQPKWLLWYGLSLTAAFLAGAFLILRRGLKDIAAENPVARSWPRWKLSITAAVFLLIFGVVFNAMETIRQDARNVEEAHLQKPALYATANAAIHLKERLWIQTTPVWRTG